MSQVKRNPRSSVEGRLVQLFAELGEIPGWPNVHVHAGLLLWDVLSALGWSRARIRRVLGFDATVYTRRQTASPADWPAAKP